MDQSWKTKELPLEIYKGLAQCIYKEPANRNFGDCAKEVLTNLQAQENSNQKKGACRKQDGKIFSRVESWSSKHFKLLLTFDI